MNHKIDLTPAHLDFILKILKKNLPSTSRVWLFGSRARGDAKIFSDVDLLIDIGSPISLELMSKLNLEFEESALPYKIDIADAAAISAAFRKNIESQLVQLIN